jgi:hypothetical protein
MVRPPNLFNWGSRFELLSSCNRYLSGNLYHSQSRSDNLRTLSRYSAIDVWERKNNGTVVRYRCLESLTTGRFSVQSADFFHDGKTPGGLDTQFLELFAEQEPSERSGEHQTIEAAIAAHKRDFPDD